jgi:hypothetical protein
VRFEVFTAVRIVMFFWVLAPWVDTRVSEKHTIFIFIPENGDSMFLRNVGIYRRVCTAPRPGTTSSVAIYVSSSSSFTNIVRLETVDRFRSKNVVFSCRLLRL